MSLKSVAPPHKQGVSMSKFKDYMMELDAREKEAMDFEFFYWSVVNDVAMLIKDNGYNEVLKDILDTVQRIVDKQQSDGVQ
jgi:hypothetical protein